MELASRDVISMAEQTEIDEGRGVDGNVLLDLRHLGAEKILERLHGTRGLSMTFAGVDPIYEPIPVRPGAHYHMGGVDTDVWGRTELEGLYAAGECACVSVHGANRLGGNALMETITFGKRSGRHAAEWALANTTVTVPEGIVSASSSRICHGRSPSERSRSSFSSRSASASTDAGTSTVVCVSAHSDACRPTRLPYVIVSMSAFPPSLLAPCTDTQATSPAA